MGTVSAIPEHLFKYADTCTQGADQLQTWVRTVLGPALRDYQNGGGVCAAIDGEVAQQVAAAYHTDLDARMVGQAFLQAGGVLVRTHSMPITVPEAKLNATYQQLQHQAQMKAGAALGKRLMGAHSYQEQKAIMSELARHANDPFFNAGFYNSLDGSHVETVLALGGTPALVSAYSSGALGKQVTATIAQLLSVPAVQNRAPVNLMYHVMTDAQKLELLRALGASPQASRYFAESITSEQLRDIFYGSLVNDPAFRGGLLKAGGHTVDGGQLLRERLLGVLTAGLGQETDQTTARTIVHKVSIGLFADDAPTLTNSQWKPLVKPISAFYKQAMLHDVGVPTDFSRQGLEKWQNTAGTHMGQDIALFLRKMNQADPDNELVKSMIQGGYVNVGFMFLAPEGVAGTFAVGALQSLYSAYDPVSKYGLDKVFGEGQHPNTYQVNQELATGGFLYSLSLLVAQGKVHDRNGDVVRFKGTADDGKLLDSILQHRNDDPPDYTTGPDKVTVKELLDYFGAKEKDEPLNALGNPDYKPPYK